MDEVKKAISHHNFKERWLALEKAWPQHLGEIDAILIKDGIASEEVLKLKTLAFQYWLFNFEFINSIVIISKTKIIFFTSKEKIEYFVPLKKAIDEIGKELIFIEKTEKSLDNDIKILFEKIEKSNFKKFGIFIRETQKGKLIESFGDFFAQAKLKEMDISSQIQEFLSVKDYAAINHLQNCAKSTGFIFRKLIDRIEKVLDEGAETSNFAISKFMEDSLSDWKANLAKKQGINPNFFDFSYSPVIQSGQKADLRPDAASSDELLSNEVILLNMACKYFEINCNIYRTILINPSEPEKKIYSSLLEIHKFLIKNLKAGIKLSEVYNAAVNFAKQWHKDFADVLPNNFGFGIGFEFKEACLLIGPKNERAIKPGNAFTVVTSFKDVPGKNGLPISLHVADTILINLNGRAENLTEATSVNLAEIAYNLELDAKKSSEKKKAGAKTKGLGDKENAQLNKKSMEAENGPISARTRRSQKGQEFAGEQLKLQRIKMHQKELLAAKTAEIQERLKSGNFSFKQTDEVKTSLENIKTYSNDKSIRNLSAKIIYVDFENNAVLVPVNGRLIPFHVSCVKNVTKSNDGKLATLRINFFTPGISAPNIIFPAPNSFGTHPIYLKELTFKSANGENYAKIFQDVKDLQRKLKSKAIEEHEKRSDQVILQGKLKSLNEVKMRPTLSGRKTVGTLTAYSNGFKFVSKRSEVFEIPLLNIKHAIFQPCQENMLILIHFVLKEPIIVNKKPQLHIQFYSEVVVSSEEVSDPKRKSRMHDYDELEEEELELQAREHFNKMFLDFVTQAEKNWAPGLKFDSPFHELGFYGSPFYNSVYVIPSAFCLVSLIETPFFVVALDEIEMVSLERTDNAIKNFDMIIVFKDYSRPVQAIRNISKSDLEKIRVWLELAKKRPEYPVLRGRCFESEVGQRAEKNKAEPRALFFQGEGLAVLFRGRRRGGRR